MADRITSDDLFIHLKKIELSKDTRALEHALIQIMPRLGFPYFALSERASDFNKAPDYLLNHLPAGWLAEKANAFASVENPVHELCRTRKTVLWSDAPKIMSMSRRQSDLMNRARDHGLKHGLTFSFLAAAGGSFLFSVARSIPENISNLEIVASRYIGYSIIEKVVSLRKASSPNNINNSLTPRQISCIHLVSKGLSDQQIAKSFNISAETVKEHISMARLKLGVKRRAELVYMLTKAGLIA